MIGLRVIDEATTSSVCPSGVALATSSVPTMLPAPGRFSMSPGWPRSSVQSLRDQPRGESSVDAPGVCGTTMRTGRPGHASFD